MALKSFECFHLEVVHLQDVLVVELHLPEGLVERVPLVPEDLLKPDVSVLPVDVVQIRGRKSGKMKTLVEQAKPVQPL